MNESANGLLDQWLSHRGTPASNVAPEANPEADEPPIGDDQEDAPSPSEEPRRAATSPPEISDSLAGLTSIEDELNRLAQGDESDAPARSRFTGADASEAVMAAFAALDQPTRSPAADTEVDTAIATGEDVPKPDAEPEASTLPDTHIESDPGNEMVEEGGPILPFTEPAPEPEPTPQPVPDPDPEPVPDREPVPDPEPEPEPIPEPDRLEPPDPAIDPTAGLEGLPPLSASTAAILAALNAATAAPSPRAPASGTSAALTSSAAQDAAENQSASKTDNTARDTLPSGPVAAALPAPPPASAEQPGGHRPAGRGRRWGRPPGAVQQPAPALETPTDPETDPLAVPATRPHPEVEVEDRTPRDDRVERVIEANAPAYHDRRSPAEIARALGASAPESPSPLSARRTKSDDISSAEHHFRPRRAGRRLLTLLLALGLVATVAACWWAFSVQTLPSIGVATVVGIATAIIWAARAGDAVTRLSTVGSRLIIERAGTRTQFDLADPHTPVEVHGDPQDSEWNVTFHRRGMTPVVLDSSVVDPAEFMAVFRLHRPQA